MTVDNDDHLVTSASTMLVARHDLTSQHETISTAWLIRQLAQYGNDVHAMGVISNLILGWLMQQLLMQADVAPATKHRGFS